MTLTKKSDLRIHKILITGSVYVKILTVEMTVPETKIMKH